MENLGSWIWIIIAIFWLGAKILPRMFGGRGGETEVPAAEPTPPPASQPAPQLTETGEPVDMGEGPVTDFDTLISSLNKARFAPQRKSEAPPPIEPK